MMTLVAIAITVAFYLLDNQIFLFTVSSTVGAASPPRFSTEV
jgi:hypothetical protein